MVLMYICICNAITERQVKEAVENGVSTLSQLQGTLGVASCCGACAETALDYLPGGKYAGQCTAYAAQLEPSYELHAANDLSARPARQAVVASLA